MSAWLGGGLSRQAGQGDFELRRGVGSPPQVPDHVAWMTGVDVTIPVGLFLGLVAGSGPTHLPVRQPG